MTSGDHLVHHVTQKTSKIRSLMALSRKVLKLPRVETAQPLWALVAVLWPLWDLFLFLKKNQRKPQTRKNTTHHKKAHNNNHHLLISNWIFLCCNLVHCPLSYYCISTRSFRFCLLHTLLAEDSPNVSPLPSLLKAQPLNVCHNLQTSDQFGGLRWTCSSSVSALYWGAPNCKTYCKCSLTSARGE